MRLFSLAFALSVAVVPALPAHAGQSRPVDCELVVKGQTYIKGRCHFFPEPDGSFQIRGGDYFAQIKVTGKNTGEVNWNETPDAMHAHSYLGTVKRKGACWSNATVKVCARALSEAETAAALATQPDGMMLSPDFAYYTCIGVEGPLAEGATPVLHNCKIPDDLIFQVAADGTLAIDKHPELCIDLESPGMMKPAQLVLIRCDAGARTWRWTGHGVEAGAVQSTDGLCWTIPQIAVDRDAREPFPWTIQPQPCSGGTADPVKFFLSKD